MGLGRVVIGQEEIPCKHYINWSISRALACRAGSTRYCIRTLTMGLVPHEASDRLRILSLIIDRWKLDREYVVYRFRYHSV
jgi:hypothetical protein